MLASDAHMMTGWHIAALVLMGITAAFVVVSAVALLAFWTWEAIRRRSTMASHRRATPRT